jgi:hypothetical protein
VGWSTSEGLFIADGPVEAQIRFDLVAVRLPGGSRIDLDNGVTPWSPWGCCLSLNLRAVTGTERGDRPEVAVDVRTGQPPAGHYLEVAVDERGHLFVGRRAGASDPHELFTRGRLDLSSARRLGRVGTPGGRESDALTSCTHRVACEVIYRGDVLLAPLDGELRCTSDGVLELADDDVVIRFARLQAVTLQGVSCPPGLPLRVDAGDEIVDGGALGRLGVSVAISAETSQGAAIPVAIAEDGALYIGGLTLTLGCPCRNYS